MFLATCCGDTRPFFPLEESIFAEPHMMGSMITTPLSRLTGAGHPSQPPVTPLGVQCASPPSQSLPFGEMCFITLSKVGSVTISKTSCFHLAMPHLRNGFLSQKNASPKKPSIQVATRNDFPARRKLYFPKRAAVIFPILHALPEPYYSHIERWGPCPLSWKMGGAL